LTDIDNFRKLIMFTISIIIINNKIALVMMQTISQAISAYLDSVALARSNNTARTYKNALRAFKSVLQERWLDPESTSIENLSEDSITWFAEFLKIFSAPTERLYLTAVSGFYEYLAAERLAAINLPRLKLLIRQRARRPGIRLPQFPVEDIEKVLEFVNYTTEHTFESEKIKLRALRDRAFLLTLADTGLRVHEACSLRRGDVDWNEGRAVIVGKGDKQAVVRFSRRSLNALRDYLAARSQLDGNVGRPLTSLPLFARHDKGAGKKIKPISTATGRNIVADCVRQALGDEAVGSITPHSFRHYFVTTILRASGNLKLAQELARHSNIQVTQRYAHLSDDELDKGYYEIFEKNS
jgi:site-specific recombinase XerD